uniref:Putative secreted protein n=1 Tax=Anopheles marajoara TaxID=58244 RepID=A0A2M4CCT5_9DIPT
MRLNTRPSLTSRRRTKWAAGTTAASAAAAVAAATEEEVAAVVNHSLRPPLPHANNRSFINRYTPPSSSFMFPACG